MRVLVLGGTGSIGQPLVRELVRRRHDVMALARSEVSIQILTKLKAVPIAGDVKSPGRWLGTLAPPDAVIHAAATFENDNGLIERLVLESLLPFLAHHSPSARFIYTGGCWLFGANCGAISTEETPFDPLPFLSWCTAHIRLVLAAPGVEAIIIHPAMVYEPRGGVFGRFYDDAVSGTAVRVVGSERVRWPLVHSEDLATLYCLALERGAPGESYVGAAIDGMPVGRIARAYARRFRTCSPDPTVMSEEDSAVELGLGQKVMRAINSSAEQRRAAASGGHRSIWTRRLKLTPFSSSAGPM
jgi:nucleoside-diphosphate-sugar epimerase